MVLQKNNPSQKTIVAGEGRLLETLDESQTEQDQKNISPEYVLEFISKHHLNRLWDEFVYEKTHPKIELSAREVLEMINMPPEEQERILKDHE